MGVCKSKGQSVNSIRKVQPKQFEASKSQQRLLQPKASRILDVNYQQIPNKFKRTQNLTQDENCELGGLIGLRNSGNSCFMNSAIQLLSNTEPLTDYFISDLHTSELNPSNPLSSQGQVTETFASLIKQLWQKARVDNPTKDNQNMINPVELVKTMQSWAPQFAMGTQEDSHEFLAFLLDMIHEDLNRVKIKPQIVEKDYTGQPNQSQADESWHGYLMRNRSVIVDLFQGQQKSSLKCQTCKYESHRYEPFMYLSLPVFDQHETRYKAPFLLEDCIKEYCKEENLKNDEQWMCPKCKVRRDCVKKIDLWTMPNILVIHLKRFKFTREKKCKLRTFIDFPLSGLNFQNISLGRQTDAPIYDLYGVINHEGSLGRGHYYSYAKNRDDLNWYCFNDSNVTLIQDAEDTVVSKDAYLLFFYKNSVDEFRRQTLTNDQLNVYDSQDSPTKTMNTPKVIFQKSLKNSMSMKNKPKNIVIHPREKSFLLDESQNISILQEGQIQYDPDKTPRHIKSSTINHGKVVKFIQDEPLNSSSQIPFLSSNRITFNQLDMGQSYRHATVNSDRPPLRFGFVQLRGNNQKQKKEIKISLPQSENSDDSET